MTKTIQKKTPRGIRTITMEQYSVKTEWEILQVHEPVSQDKMYSSRQVIKLFDAERQADRETMYILHLNSRLQILEKELVALGRLNCCGILPREVFKKAIVLGAGSIITVHNHPSGDTTPSREDEVWWKIIDKAGTLLGINVLDHIIITPDGRHYSRKDGC